MTDRVAPLLCECENGHHFTPKKGMKIDSSITCPCPVYGDGEIALFGSNGDPNPFSNPAVRECGAEIDVVCIDIFDYEAGRYT